MSDSSNGPHDESPGEDSAEQPPNDEASEDEHGEAQGSEGDGSYERDETSEDAESGDKDETGEDAESGSKGETGEDAESGKNGGNDTKRADEETSTIGSTLLSRRAALATLGGIGLFGAGAAVSRQRPQELVRVDEDEAEWVLEFDGEAGVVVSNATETEFGDTAIRANEQLVVGRANERAEDVVGATITGGGYYDLTEEESRGNVVKSQFGTISGGADNLVGDAGSYAAVGGGSGNEAGGTRSTIAGGSGNETSGNRSTIAGGGGNESQGSFATIGGGRNNVTEDEFDTVSGGLANETADGGATIGGGEGNTALGERTTVAGGETNTAVERWATVGGGRTNTASATGATVPGGAENTADGNYSFAAGRQADADGHDGAIVFGDSSTARVRAQGDDTAVFQMPVYAPEFHVTSTETAKSDVEPVNPESVLDGVTSLDIARWEFTTVGSDARHIGPMAEQFQETFGVGERETIASVDADGVALAAIQGLWKRLERREKRIDELEGELEAQSERVSELEERLVELESSLESSTDTA